MKPRTAYPSITVWIGWMAATIAAAFTLITFIYTTFSTKSEAQNYQDTLEKRLDRLENKIDHLISK